MKQFEELTEEQQNEVILNISSKLDKQEIWYWEGLVHKLREQHKEIERLNNIINECANEILIELKANHHLSYGVALSIRQKLIDYKELKGE